MSVHNRITQYLAARGFHFNWHLAIGEPWTWYGPPAPSFILAFFEPWTWKATSPPTYSRAFLEYWSS